MAKDPITQREFLSTLWGEDNHGIAELTTILNRTVKSSPFAYPADLDKLIEAANHQNGKTNVYMGVCLKREKWPRKTGKKEPDGSDEIEYRGTKDNALSSMCVWADIDFKNNPREEALKRVSEFPLRPSIVVKSGGGVHLYWLLKEPAVGTDLTTRVPGINSALVKVLKSDKQAVDLARILRLPGTANVKYDHKPLCEISLPGWNPNLRYTLDDFDFLTPEVEPLPGLLSPADSVASTEPQNGAAPAGPPTLPSIELSKEICSKVSELLSKIWIKGSRHKFALCVPGMLAHAGVSEASAKAIVGGASDAVDGDTQGRMKDVEDTYKKFCSGEEVIGLPSIEKHIEDDFPEIARDKAKRILADVLKLLPKPPRSKKRGEEVKPNFKVLKIIKFDSRPARYTAKIWHECGQEYEVNCEIDVFNEFWKFRRAFFEATPNRTLAMIEQGVWESLISPEKTVLEIRPAPEEATSKGMVKVELESFLDNKKENPEPGELKSFAGYTDKEVFFTLNAFRGHLKSVGVAKVTDREIIDIIKNEGWKGDHRRIGGKTSRIWLKELQNGNGNGHPEKKILYPIVLPSSELFPEDSKNGTGENGGTVAQDG